MCMWSRAHAHVMCCDYDVIVSYKNSTIQITSSINTAVILQYRPALIYKYMLVKFESSFEMQPFREGLANTERLLSFPTEVLITD